MIPTIDDMAKTGLSSIYLRCLTCWARPTSWCEWCVSLDHDSKDCPFSFGSSHTTLPFNLPLTSPLPSKSTLNMLSTRSMGEFGQGCKYRHAMPCHVCSICEEPQPKSKCTKSSGRELKSSAVSVRHSELPGSVCLGMIR